MEGQNLTPKECTEISHNINNEHLADIEVGTCDRCYYIKDHFTQPDSTRDYLPASHFTCICSLFESSCICCVDGYYNLLLSIPILSIFTPLPALTGNEAKLLSGPGLAIRSMMEHDNFVKVCTQIKLDAMNKSQYLNAQPNLMMFVTEI